MILIVLLLCLLTSHTVFAQDTVPIAPIAPTERYFWFTAVGGFHDHHHALMMQVAIESVLECCTNLLYPVIIYGGPPDGAPDWLRTLDDHHLAVAKNHNFSFNSALPAGRQGHGAYLRLDIPIIIDELVHRVANHAQISSQYAMYTDCDVLFHSLPVMIKPPVISLGAQWWKNTKENSGVMFLNITALRTQMPACLAYAVAKNWTFKFPGYDQPLILEYFRPKLTQLPDVFNWKPYWGLNGNASIIHTHGTKVGQAMDCFIAMIDDKDHQYGAKCSAASKAIVNLHRLVEEKMHILFREQVLSYVAFSADFYSTLFRFKMRIKTLWGHV